MFPGIVDDAGHGETAASSSACARDCLSLSLYLWTISHLRCLQWCTNQLTDAWCLMMASAVCISDASSFCPTFIAYVREGTPYIIFGTNPPTEGLWASR